MPLFYSYSTHNLMRRMVNLYSFVSEILLYSITTAVQIVTDSVCFIQSLYFHTAGKTLWTIIRPLIDTLTHCWMAADRFFQKDRNYTRHIPSFTATTATLKRTTPDELKDKPSSSFFSLINSASNVEWDKQTVPERFFWDLVFSSIRDELFGDNAVDNLQAVIKDFKNRYSIQTVKDCFENTQAEKTPSTRQYNYDETFFANVDTGADTDRSHIDTMTAQVRYTSYLAVITRVDLSNCNITYIPPFFYRHLNQLQQLILTRNGIRAIPEDMPEHTLELTVLRLDGNHIANLPVSINCWTKLQELWLGSEFGGGNEICYLPGCISSLTSLSELNISRNRLGSLSAIAIQQLRNIKHIDLSYNRLKWLPEDVSVADCHQLASMDLSNNQLAELPFTLSTDLVRLIQDHSFRYLDVSNNELSVLPQELLSLPQAQIVIRGNPMAINTHNYLQQSRVEGYPHNYLGYGSVGDNNESNGNGADGNDGADEEALETDDGGITENAAATTENDHQFNISAAITAVADNFVGFDINDNYGEDYNETGHTTLDVSEHDNNSPTVFSLKEIALRLFVTAYPETGTVASLLPEYILFDIQKNLHFCLHCLGPFIYEWQTTIQFKTMHGYPSVPHQVRFCSTKCMKDYGGELEQKCLAAQSNVALSVIRGDQTMPEPDSFEWILMAMRAASAQEEDDNLLANIAMTML